MNTRDKRSSAIHVNQPWRGLLPLPDGSLNQGDRQHVSLLYRGILSSGSVVAVVDAFRGFIANMGRMMK